MKKKKTNSPELAKWLLRRILRQQNREPVIGDFEEIYAEIAEDHGLLNAKVWYWWHIFKSLPAFINNAIYWSAIMFLNYVKVAFRNLMKSKTYSFINVSGLAVGLACFIFIASFIQSQLSFDRFHENGERIYRINQVSDRGGGSLFYTASTMAPLAAAVESEVAGVERATRLAHAGRKLIRHGDLKFYESGMYWADDDFLDILTFPLISGEKRTALNAPNSILVTAKMAQKYFDDEDPVGQTLFIDNQTEFTVTGVLQDVPVNSSVRFDFLASFASVEPTAAWKGRWGSHFLRTFLLLKNGASPTAVEGQIASVVDKYYNPRPPLQKLFLQPISDLRLYKVDRSPGFLNLLYALVAIAATILLIAAINYMNLATARSARRVKEVGLRKVVGASRLQLAKQFLGESILLSLVALPFAVVLFNFLYAAVATLPGVAPRSNVISDFLSSPLLIGVVLVTTLLVGIAGGTYPAFVLSRSQPTAVINASSEGKRARLRKALVILQFAFSIVFMICTTILHNQLDFLKTKDLGFKTEQIVSVELEAEDLREIAPSLKSELLRHHNVLSATLSSSVPARLFGRSSSVTAEGEPPQASWSMHVFPVDHDYIETFGLEIVAGRSFSKEMSTDADEAYIVNETAVEKFGWDSAPGKRLHVHGQTQGSVIGVLKDFHFQEMMEEIKPAVLYVDPEAWSVLSLKINPNNITDTIEFARSKWQTLAADYPFEFSFFDQTSEKLYRVHNLMFALARGFSFFAIFIACLGLFGLAAFAAETRTKEIGVRKVLGATVPSVMTLLSKDFLKLILIAFVFAAPAAWFVMNLTLQNFAYRTEIGASSFLLVGLAALVIAIVTVGYQAVKTSLANPVEALRYE